MKTSPLINIGRLISLKTLWVALIFWGALSGIIPKTAAAAWPHTWTGDPVSPYGLTDLDNFSDSYNYCKWGTLMSNQSEHGGFLPYTPLTDSSDKSAFFLNIGKLTLGPISPATAFYRDDPLNSKLGYTTSTVWSIPPFNYSLFRKLHLPDALIDEKSRNAIDGQTKKLIVLIHGWNSMSMGDNYGDNSREWLDLVTQLKKAMLNAPDWKLVEYHWEKDADTGPPDPSVAAENGTRAAEIANRHGQHLGELLDRLTQQNLEKIHFIVHSAGSWAARSAAKYLLTARYNSPSSPRIKMQMTLLDPFVPGVVQAFIGGSTSLTTDRMSEINSWSYGGVPLSTADNLYRLENYYAIDTNIVEGWYEGNYTAGTQAIFGWRSGVDINLQVDWPNPNTGVSYYRRHAGPIAFYADTVRSPSLQSLPELQNPAFSGIQGSIGWRQSMFFQEPQITLQPSLGNIVAPGYSPTLTSNAQKRGFPTSPGLGITFQWQRAVTGSWTDIVGATGPNYTIPSVTAAMEGTQYRLKVSNNAGIDISNSATLHVGTSGGTVPARPSGLTATGTSPSQINLSWNDNSNNETGFLIQRKSGAGPYATVGTAPASSNAKGAFFDNTGLVQGTLYYYQVIASGPTNSDPSNEISASTQANTGLTRILTVNSTNPGSGVHIYVIPNDANGLSEGDTPVSRQYTSSLTATVVASPAWNGNAFLKWLKDGQEWSTTTVANVVMDTSHTITAIYAPPVATGYTISTSRSPASGGTTSGDGIYASGASVTIIATPSTGYQFLNWTLNTSSQSGGTFFTPNATSQFAANGNLSLVANFVQNSPGTIITTTASPPNGGTTSGTGVYQVGQPVPVAATPANGWEFGTWTDEYGGLVSFSSSFTYAAYQSRTYVAHFNPILSQNYTLAITALNGTAIRSPNQVAYTPSSQVSITATAASGYQFAGWSGDASGSINPLLVTTDTNKSVTAIFSTVAPGSYTLDTHVNQNTGGTITKSANQASYTQGSVVQLTATAISGYQFTGWRGSAFVTPAEPFGTSNPLSVTTDANKLVIGNFTQISAGTSVLSLGSPTTFSLPATAGSYINPAKEKIAR